MQVRDGMSEVVADRRARRTRCARRRRRWSRRGPVRRWSSTTRRRLPAIVTERDILISVGAGEDPDTERVADHMSDSVIAAAPDWSLERAAAEMSRRGVRHLVVFDGRRAGRRALDARHRPRLDQRRARRRG